MASRAASSVNHAARSTSGNSACLPERGGHSMVNALLLELRRVAVVLHGPGEDELVAVGLDAAEGLEGPRGLQPRLLLTSRRATASRSTPAARLRALAAVTVAGSGPSSSGSATPWGCSRRRRPSWPSTGRRGGRAAPRARLAGPAGPARRR